MKLVELSYVRTTQLI